jgi:type IV secretion system protein VirB1
MIDFLNLAQQCAPTVDPRTMAAIVQVESTYNPYAIGVVGGRLVRQPKNKEEAIATATALEKQDWNFSVGMSQINRYNLSKFNMTYSDAFDPCANLRAGSKLLEDCYTRANTKFYQQEKSLQAAFSCYYSGNFTRGFRPDKPGQTSYVQKVLASANLPVLAIPVVPDIKNANKTRKIPQIRKSPAQNNPLVFDDHVSQSDTTKKQKSTSPFVFSENGESVT